MRQHIVLRIVWGENTLPFEAERLQGLRRLLGGKTSDALPIETWAAPENPTELFRDLRLRICDHAADENKTVLAIEYASHDAILLAALGVCVMMTLIPPRIPVLVPVFATNNGRLIPESGKAMRSEEVHLAHKFRGFQLITGSNAVGQFCASHSQEGE